MDSIQNGNIYALSGKLCEELKQLPFYESFYLNLQNIAASEAVNEDCFKDSLLTAIRKAGLETSIRNEIYHYMCDNSWRDKSFCWLAKEPIGYVRKAQMQWERKLYKSLNSMCTEIGIPLSTIRLTSDRNEVLEKWNTLSTYEIDLSQYRPVYAPKDFMEVLLAIQNPNYKDNVNGNDCYFPQLPLKVKSLEELGKLYYELAKNTPLLDMCSDTDFNSLHNCMEADAISNGKKVLQYNHGPVTREFLKKPAPHSLRGDLWLQALGCNLGKWHDEYFSKLKQLVAHYSMLVDHLIIKDIQLTVSNDDQYFVFEDIIYQVLLCFCRDTTVTSVFQRNSSNPLIGTIKGKPQTTNNAVIYPPSGLIPFHGFSMYVAPFCYLYNNPVKLYFTFRSFYTNYIFRMHEVSSHRNGILSLCVLFSQLLQQHEHHLWLHFKSINIEPIKIVFKWIMRCFSGYLPPEQLLYLYDVILGYDSTEILPLLAVAILSFRRENLLQADSVQLIEAVLADLSSVRVIPLLQFSLTRNGVIYK